MKVPKHSTAQGFESSSTGSKTTFWNSTQAHKQLYLGISAVELMQPVHESSFSLSVSFNGTDEQHLIFSGVLETEQQNSLVTTGHRSEVPAATLPHERWMDSCLLVA